jgi:hypothetical protein
MRRVSAVKELLLPALLEAPVLDAVREEVTGSQSMGPSRMCLGGNRMIPEVAALRRRLRPQTDCDQQYVDLTPTNWSRNPTSRGRFTR